MVLALSAIRQRTFEIALIDAHPRLHFVDCIRNALENIKSSEVIKIDSRGLPRCNRRGRKHCSSDSALNLS